MNRPFPDIQKQRGVALFVGLMFLLVLTMLGLSASQGSIMQERMAGNVADANIAFQRAEGTLRLAEQKVIRYIEGGSGGLGFVPPNLDKTGLDRNNCTMSGYDWDGASWNAASETGGKFLVFKVAGLESGAGQLFGSNCSPPPSANNPTAGEYYMIVARASGPTGTSESIVQSIFFRPN